jgi:hypothetical protein
MGVPTTKTTAKSNLSSHCGSPTGPARPPLQSNFRPSPRQSVLNVTGTATLGGTLNIGLLNNFVPPIGAEFEILTAKQVTGTFATVNGTKINGSEHFTVTYNSDNVTLTVVSGD